MDIADMIDGYGSGHSPLIQPDSTRGIGYDFLSYCRLISLQRLIGHIYSFESNYNIVMLVTVASNSNAVGE